jgi:hypothetical protein
MSNVSSVRENDRGICPLLPIVVYSVVTAALAQLPALHPDQVFELTQIL